MRPARPEDLDAVTSYLETQAERAMFPLSNLRRHGLDGDHPHAPRMWIDGRAGVEGVLTITRNGTVMPNCAPEAAAPVLAGRAVLGVIGPTELCRPLIDTLDLGRGGVELDQDEPQFMLDLDDLVIPDGPGVLHPFECADRAEMIAWRRAYSEEALGRGRQAAEVSAAQDYASYVAAGSHRVLIADGQAVSTTGFNATLPGIVQVGGVYTPPALRGRGHARRAVALHLEQARAAGVERATLFADNAAAQRAYAAIGFRACGSWTLLMRSTPLTLETDA